MRRLFLRFGAAGDSDGQFVASPHVCAAPAPKPDVCAQPGEGGSRAGTQTAQQSRHQTRVGPVPGISRQQSHARVSPVRCTWGGDTTEMSLKGLNLGGNSFGANQEGVVGAATDCKELCGPVLLPSGSGVEQGAGGSGDLPGDTASFPSPRVSGSGMAVSWWKGRNPLLEQLCPPGGCCSGVPIPGAVPTSAGREVMETQ